jgi:hypothetical protein
MRTNHSRRRDFIIGCAAVTWPLAARAQQAAMPVIGFLGAATPSAFSQWVAAFVQRLRELGWTRVAPSRSSIAGRRAAPSVTVISQQSSYGSRSMLSSRRGPQSPQQSRRHRSSRSSSRYRGTRWASRESGTTGRQRHRSVDPADRSCYKATRSFARGCP